MINSFFAGAGLAMFGLAMTILMLIFTIIVVFIIFRGVNNGIESSSKIIMPLLIILVLGSLLISPNV